MGNTSDKRLTVQFGNRKEELNEKVSSFSNFKLCVKNLFNIDESTPIVIRCGSDYISTRYKWDQFIQPKDLTLEVWEQIEPKVRNTPSLSPFLKHIFKIQNKSDKTVGLGLFISQNLCIVPKTLVQLDDFCRFVGNNTIRFFDESEAQFSLEKFHWILGNHLANQHFAIFEVSRDICDYKVNFPKVKKSFKFHSIYFNKKYQMLSAERFTHVEIDNKATFRLKLVNEIQNSLPGAVLVSDQGEVLGIYQGNTGNLFTPMDIIFGQISNVFQGCLENDDVATRDLLLELNNLEIKLPWLTEIMNSLTDIQIPNVKVYNPLKSEQ